MDVVGKISQKGEGGIVGSLKKQISELGKDIDKASSKEEIKKLVNKQDDLKSKLTELKKPTDKQGGLLTGILGKLAVVVGLILSIKPIMDVIKLALGFATLMLLKLGKFLIKDLPGLLKGIWTKIVDKVKSTIEFIKQLPKKIWNFIKNLAKLIWNFIKIGFNILKELLKIVVGFIKGLASKIWGFMKIGFDFIKDLLKTVIIFLKGLASKIWGFIKTGFNLLKEKLSAGFDLLKGIFSKGWDLLKSIIDGIKNLASGIWDKLKTGFDFLKDKLVSVITFLKELPGKIWNFLKDLPSLIGTAIKNKLPGFLGGGKDDFVQRPGQAPTSFSPKDTIIGIKNPADIGGNKTFIFNGVTPKEMMDVINRENAIGVRRSSRF